MEAKELTPQELRIGNWVYFTDFPVKNNPIQLKQRDLYLENWVMYFCSPIPLTQEWLEKFGFAKGVCKINDLEFRVVFETAGEDHIHTDICQTIDDELETIYLTDKIKHVHELQNLIFILTGKELTLNT